jgi:hypothetical protein
MDLDNVWSYLKTHGNPEWESRPSYLATFIPYVLDLLDEEALTITFFVVGCDAAREEHAPALRALVQHGHEVGNHSFEHEPWLARYDRAQLNDEIARAEAAILGATGRRPLGFRGPGYAWSPELLSILAEREYLYDASTLPTYLGPLARLYYFRTSRLSAAQRAERAELFGRFSDGFRPVKPYYWETGNGRILELPVTTFPGIKVPFHFSYLLYLSQFSERLAMVYLRSALLACRLTGTEPSFLLHPLDLIDAAQEPRLAFFPGMDVPVHRKAALLRQALRMMREHFTLVTMSSHARALARRTDLRVRQPVASVVGSQR